jgi:predicted phosphoribosyltransferase
MKPRSPRLQILREGDVPSGYFADRNAAGEMLAHFLEDHRGFGNLVLGLPRGGVEVGDALARHLDADLDVFLSRKIRTPGYPELAAGAVTESGLVLWNDDVRAELPLPESAWLAELDRSRRELEGRSKAYRAALPRAPIENRDVIITDDGVATGATLRAGAMAVASLKPKSVTIAVPGGSRESLDELARLDGVDEVLAIIGPEPFFAVGQMYGDFAQLSDGYVLQLLHRANARRAIHSQKHAGAA